MGKHFNSTKKKKIQNRKLEQKIQEFMDFSGTLVEATLFYANENFS